MNERILIVLSPHHDDAVLGLGGLLAKHTALRRIVVSLFAGSSPPPSREDPTPWNRQGGFASNLQAEQYRIQENKRALRLLGIPDSDIIDCGFIDSQYRTSKIETDRQLPMLVERIKALLANYADQSISIYAPAFPLFEPPEYFHPDHILVHNALLELARVDQNPNVLFYFYDDIIPYVANFLLRHSHNEIMDFVERTHRIQLEKVVVRLAERELSKKLQSCNCYTSQISALHLPLPLRELFRQYSLAVTGESGFCEVVYGIKVPIQPTLQDPPAGARL